MIIDWRALCVDLVDWADYTSAHYYAPPEVLVRAHSALAEADEPAVPDGREPASVVEQPTDAELLELMHQSMRDDLAEVSRLAALEAGTAAGVFRVTLNYDVVRFARAAIAADRARWGRPAPEPPADGEVAELVETLKGIAYWRRHGNPGVAPAPFDIRQADRLDRAAELLERSAPAPVGEALVTDELVRQLRTKAATEKSNRCHYSAILLNRAADILERQHPQPVPVSERLPGPEDCDAEGRCWWYGEGGDMVGWTLDAEGPSYYRAKYWLPAHALQAPAGGATIG